MVIKFFGAGSLIHDRGKPQLSELAQEILVRLTDGQTIKAICFRLGHHASQSGLASEDNLSAFRVKGVAELAHAAVREGWVTHPAGQAQAEYSARSS